MIYLIIFLFKLLFSLIKHTPKIDKPKMPRTSEDVYSDINSSWEFGTECADYVIAKNDFEKFYRDPQAYYENFVTEVLGIPGIGKKIHGRSEISKAEKIPGIEELDKIMMGGTQPKGVAANLKQEIDKIKRMFFQVGAAFQDDLDVIEDDSEYFYVPSSPRCLLKAWEYLKEHYPQAVKTDVSDQLRKNLEKNTVNQKNIPKYFQVKKHVLTNGVKTRNPYGRDPRSYVIEFNLVLVNPHCRHSKEIPDYPRLLLLNTESDYAHAVVLKKPTPDDLQSLIIKFDTADLELSGKYQQVFQSPFPKDLQDRFIVIDIEADNLETHKLILLGAAVVDLSTPDPIKHLESSYTEHNTYENFLDWLYFQGSDTQTTQFFAHNAGGYDSYFLFRCGDPRIKFLCDIKVAGKYKSIKFSLDSSNGGNPRLFNAKDSLSFFQMSLDTLCKTTKNKYHNKLTDVSAKVTKTQFLECPRFHEYLREDVLSLGESLIFFEHQFRKLNLSITKFIGVPAMAMGLFTNKYITESMWIPGDRTTRLFIKQSVYGGRVLHHHKVIKEPLICLDCNSLYPAALCYDYPMGKYKVYTPQELEGLVDFWNTKPLDPQTVNLMKTKMSILEVTIDAENLRFPIVPWRADQKGLVIYPAGVFRGVYNSIDILSAVAAGYKILKIHKGIYWTRCGPSFKEFIKFLYLERKKLKSEKNPGEVIYKLLMNSFFGKFLEKIETCSTYKRPKTSKIKEEIRLANGQSRYKIKFFQTENKPKYIGSFVLSYARLIMNNLWNNLDPSEVYYSDTDSVYIPKRLVGDIPVGDELGEFKNDYGDGTEIISGVFLDYKRYHLMLKTGEKTKDSIKFNGLCTKVDALNKTPKIIGLFRGLLAGQQIDILQDRWVRTLDSGIRVDAKQLKFIVDPEKRRSWAGLLSCGCGVNQAVQPEGLRETREPKTVDDFGGVGVDLGVCGFCKLRDHKAPTDHLTPPNQPDQKQPDVIESKATADLKKPSDLTTSGDLKGCTNRKAPADREAPMGYEAVCKNHGPARFVYESIPKGYDLYKPEKPFVWGLDIQTCSNRYLKPFISSGGKIFAKVPVIGKYDVFTEDITKTNILIGKVVTKEQNEQGDPEPKQSIMLYRKQQKIGKTKYFAINQHGGFKELTDTIIDEDTIGVIMLGVQEETGGKDPNTPTDSKQRQIEINTKIIEKMIVGLENLKNQMV